MGLGELIVNIILMLATLAAITFLFYGIFLFLESYFPQILSAKFAVFYFLVMVFAILIKI